MMVGPGDDKPLPLVLADRDHTLHLANAHPLDWNRLALPRHQHRPVLVKLVPATTQLSRPIFHGSANARVHNRFKVLRRTQRRDRHAVMDELLLNRLATLIRSYCIFARLAVERFLMKRAGGRSHRTGGRGSEEHTSEPK